MINAILEEFVFIGNFNKWDFGKACFVKRKLLKFLIGHIENNKVT